MILYNYYLNDLKFIEESELKSCSLIIYTLLTNSELLYIYWPTQELK